MTNRLHENEVIDLLVGHSVVKATEDTITLSNGSRLRFESNSECCSYIDLERLSTTENIITSASYEDNEHETGGEGAYKAWIHAVTAAGELNIVEADGNASNGYYLHGFALEVFLLEPEPATDEEVDEAVASIKATIEARGGPE